MCKDNTQWVTTALLVAPHEQEAKHLGAGAGRDTRVTRRDASVETENFQVMATVWVRGVCGLPRDGVP